MRRISIVTIVIFVLTATTAWCGNLDDRIMALEAQIALIESKLATIEGNTVLQLDNLVRVDNSTINDVVGPNIIFEGANVHVQSGQGITYHYDKTTNPPNGLGNVIIGYNEITSKARTGSHNLSIGMGNGFSGYAAIVHGYHNTADNFGATIGGDGNNVSQFSVAVGGHTNNVVNEDYSSVIVGGYRNTVQDTGGGLAGYSLILGGDHNTVGLGDENVLIGGENNTVTGFHNVLLGGDANSVSGNTSLVLGGTNEASTGTYDTLLDKNYHTNP